MRHLGHALTLIAATLYTVFSGGPFFWAAMMSFRTTPEINNDPYALPWPFHWEKYLDAWTRSNYSVYFRNSTLVVFAAVVVVTVIGALAAHALARYQFRGKNVIFTILFSAILFPPQLTLIPLFQMLVEYGFINTLTGLGCVYVSIQLPLTVFILVGFFAQIPQDLYDAGKIDGLSNYEVFWRITIPVGLPAIATTVILNLISLWNEFLYAVVLITDDDKRTLPLGVQRFLGDQQSDLGMVATGMMIATIPVIVIYAIFSERIVRGMTAGAIK